MALLRLDANIMDQSSYDGLYRVLSSKLLNKVYIIDDMDFFEQLCFYE